MKKIALAGVAASVLVLAGFSGSAHAQCAWTGANWSCAPAADGYSQPYGVPYGSTYPSVGEYYHGTGYKPQWLPSAPGPRAASGAGH